MLTLVAAQAGQVEEGEQIAKSANDERQSEKMRQKAHVFGGCCCANAEKSAKDGEKNNGEKDPICLFSVAMREYDGLQLEGGVDHKQKSDDGNEVRKGFLDSEKEDGCANDRSNRAEKREGIANATTKAAEGVHKVEKTEEQGGGCDDLTDRFCGF